MKKECLNYIQDKLIELMYERLDNLEDVCAKEMYEVMDIVKDIEETKYYHAITEAMAKKNSDEINQPEHID